jgi:signal transduction histidine kinase
MREAGQDGGGVGGEQMIAAMRQRIGAPGVVSGLVRSVTGGLSAVQWRAVVPSGRSLPDEVWLPRHRAILVLLWLHVAGVAIFALWSGAVLHTLSEALLIAIPTVLGSWKDRGRRFHSAMASIALMTASAVVVHLSGGYVEAHFHFFVALAVVALYHDWVPFSCASVYVLIHHGVIGTLYPEAVFNHPSAWGSPWLWASIHGGFVLTASAVSLIHWHLNEAYRAHAEQQETARAAAEAAVRARDELLAVAAHELRTPMTSLRGYTQVMLRRHRQVASADERTRAALEIIDAQATKLTRLVEQLLDVSRVQAGKLTLTRVETDIVRLTRGVVKMASGRATDHAIVVDGEPSVLAMVDAMRLEQVLINLIDNAIKYSPDGGQVDISVERVTPEEAEVAVRDRGIGIPPEHREHIFDRFYQVTGSETMRGLGLGLHISRQIVDLHGGEIRAEFPPDGGSRFVVRLPAPVAAAASPAATVPAGEDLVLAGD